MPIFTEPDRTQYPPSLDTISCAGLEQLTGADMVIAKLPIPPTSNLLLHIKQRSLFVQIKIGYDNLSFEAIHRFAARVQAQQIPRSQAILLRIGEQWQDENGLWRLRGQSSNSGTTWSSYRRAMFATGLRGITVYPECLTSIDDLPEWIEDCQAIMQKVASESKEIYPVSNQFQPDDIWQSVEEINDWRTLFVSGLKGCGSKKVNALFDYVSEHYPFEQVRVYRILCVLTDKDSDGKYIHKIPLWGNSSRDEFRGQLGIPDGWNLSELSYRIAFYQGWQSFGNEFLRLVNKGESPKEIHKKLMDEIKNMMTDLESQIPF